jgi:putative hydrolase of the HAD superfamily
MTFRAVLFDIGGVVVESPFPAIAEFERNSGLPAGAVHRVLASRGESGSWARLERGELDLESFYPLFEEEAASLGFRLSARALFEALHKRMEPRPEMLHAIARIREQGLRTGAITNNWRDTSPHFHPLREAFDLFLESARIGLRKPDPRIYELACRQLGVEYPETVFLDDIGANLKSARSLGIHTVKVTDPTTALTELETLLGFPLR